MSYQSKLCKIYTIVKMNNANNSLSMTIQNYSNPKREEYVSSANARKKIFYKRLIKIT
jgi:hypothetical protein